jgi:hypothetical protein
MNNMRKCLPGGRLRFADAANNGCSVSLGVSSAQLPCPSLVVERWVSATADFGQGLVQILLVPTAHALELGGTLA